jgi:cytochrome P450
MLLMITTLLVAVPLLLVAHLVRNYLKLRHIPGPFLAKFTDLWRWHSMNNTHFYGPTLMKLHERYGRLVRVGPNFVSVSDPAAIGTVYGTSPVWKKGPSYEVIIGVSNGRLVHSLITMNETQQSAVMKGIGSAFTPNAVLDYEPFVDQSAALLVAALEERYSVDMGKWMQLFAMDVLNRNAFGESPGFLKTGEDIDDMQATVEKRFEYYNRWAAIPEIEYLLHKNFLVIQMGTAINNLARLARHHFQKRKEEGGEKPHQDLLQKYLDGQARFPDSISDTHVVGLVVSSIAAGADSTAMTLTAILFYLLKYPIVLAALEQEIQAFKGDGLLSPNPRWEEVKNLPYLDAVIKETMRFFPVNASGLDRVVPHGGCSLAGAFLPAETVVGCFIDSVQRDVDVYGEDAGHFRPEMWLVTDKGRLKKMNRASLSFGAGKRICVGRHIALMEMKKVIPLLVSRFNVSKCG